MHAITQPKGLNKLVIADSPASMELWLEAANKLRSELPKDVEASNLLLFFGFRLSWTTILGGYPCVGDKVLICLKDTLKKHEKDGTTDTPEYEAAVQVFYEKHVCRVVPFPKDVTDSFAALAEDNTVYLSMFVLPLPPLCCFHLFLSKMRLEEVTDEKPGMDLPSSS